MLSFDRHPAGGSARRLVGAALIACVLALGLALPVGAVEGPTKLFDVTVSPRTGTPATQITFSVEYRNREGSAPAYVRVVIDGTAHDMTADGGTDWKKGVGHTFTATLPVGVHEIDFEASDTRRFSGSADGGQVTIELPPTPPPTPKPTPAPTPEPTPAPTPDPAPGGGTGGSGSGANGGTGGSTTGGGVIGGGGAGGGDGTNGGSGGPTSGWGESGTGGAGAGGGLPTEGGTTDGPTAGTVDGPNSSGSPDDRSDGSGPGGSDDPSSPGAGSVTSPRSGGGSGGSTAAAGHGGASGYGGGRASAGGTRLVSRGDGPVVGEGWGALANALSALGVDGGPELRLLPTMVGTTGAVAMALAFAIFGKKRRDEEQPVPDDVLHAQAARGTGQAASGALAHAVVAQPATPGPVDLEAGLPRWRRPSLLEARKADPTRTVVTSPRLSFEQGRVQPVDGLERRVIRYRVVRLLDAPDELRSVDIGQLDQGDEVQLLERSGAYWLVLCPDGRQGWLHKMTLGEVVAGDGTDDAAEDVASVDDVLAAYLAARAQAS